MGNLRQVKTALITALLCFLALEVIMQIITPLLPWLITCLVLVTIGGLVYVRSTRL